MEGADDNVVAERRIGHGRAEPMELSGGLGMRRRREPPDMDWAMSRELGAGAFPATHAPSNCEDGVRGTFEIYTDAVAVDRQIDVTALSRYPCVCDRLGFCSWRRLDISTACWRCEKEAEGDSKWAANSLDIDCS